MFNNPKTLCKAVQKLSNELNLLFLFGVTAQKLKWSPVPLLRLIIHCILLLKYDLVSLLGIPLIIKFIERTYQSGFLSQTIKLYLSGYLSGITKK